MNIPNGSLIHRFRDVRESEANFPRSAHPSNNRYCATNCARRRLNEDGFFLEEKEVSSDQLYLNSHKQLTRDGLPLPLLTDFLPQTTRRLHNVFNNYTTASHPFNWIPYAQHHDAKKQHHYCVWWWSALARSASLTLSAGVVADAPSLLACNTWPHLCQSACACMHIVHMRVPHTRRGVSSGIELIKSPITITGNFGDTLHVLIYIVHTNER